MAVPLPERFIESLLDDARAAAPAIPGWHRRRGTRTALAWGRWHQHRAGLAYGLLPVGLELRVLGAVLLQAARGHAELAVPALPEATRDAVGLAALALSVGDRDAARALLDGASAPGRRRDRQLAALGQAWGAHLAALCAPMLTHAQRAALWTAEATALGRSVRRLLHDGTRLTRARAERLLAQRAADRVRALSAVVALEGHALDHGVRRALAAAGMARPDVRAAAVPASLADVPRLLRAAHAVDQLATGRDVDAAALARAWDVPPPHAARALRRARQALRLHGRRVAAPSPAVPAAPPRAEFLANQVAGWTQRVVLRHLDSLVKEIRETGELAALLAKAASGNTLSEQEWQKVREQLLDVCRAVPSLAVFALPGGALLLPVLLRVLPFDLRPSSFRGDPGAAPPSPGTPAIENLP